MNEVKYPVQEDLLTQIVLNLLDQPHSSTRSYLLNRISTEFDMYSLIIDSYGADSNLGELDNE